MKHRDYFTFGYVIIIIIIIIIRKYDFVNRTMPVAAAERSKAWTVFDRSEAVIAGSNPALGAWMINVVYTCFPVFVLSCLGRGLAPSWSPVQGVLPPVYRLGNWNKSGQGPQGLWSHWKIK
jgi:hypothetical protein